MIHFVVSSPRSGSTWLMKAIDQHPQIYATELRLFGEFCEIWPDGNGKTTPRITLDKFADATAMHFNFQSLGMRRRDFIHSFQLEYLEFVKSFVAKRASYDVILDKVTPYAGTCQSVIERIVQYFPDAKLIHLVRDGRDVVTSGAFDWLPRGNQASAAYRRYVLGDEGVGAAKLFDEEFLLNWATHWNECQVAVRECGHEFLQIRYESMLEDQARELARIFDYLELDADPQLCQQCANAVSFERTTGRARGEADPTAKMRRGVAGDWKNYFTSEDLEKFDSIAAETLRSLNY